MRKNTCIICLLFEKSTCFYFFLLLQIGANYFFGSFGLNIFLVQFIGGDCFFCECVALTFGRETINFLPFKMVPWEMRAR